MYVVCTYKFGETTYFVSSSYRSISGDLIHKRPEKVL